ncbi:MAG: amidase [Pseudomonadota bacterium]|nr:amidase [Pseudomonadota bacterium]
MGADLHFLGVRQLRAGYESKTFSPVEVARACLDRIDALNADFGAYCFVDHAAALRQARESEQRWLRGAPLGRIDGVPASIKDLFNTKGWPTRKGSRLAALAGSEREDAPCTARLREAGAVLLGKTTTPEIGWKGITDNPNGDVARNPHDRALTAGGSSGGAAVAAALGMGVLHIGSDGGGSIRIPSAFCGVFGLKPSFGRVPAYPPSAFGDVAHVGPMTRCVEDAAEMLNVIAEPDSRDPFTLPYEPLDYVERLALAAPQPKCCWSANLGFVEVDREISALCETAMRRLACEGFVFVDRHFAIPNPQQIFHRLWFTGAAAALRLLDAEARAALDPGLAAISAEGAALAHMDYVEATMARAALRRDINLQFDAFDFLISPAMPIAAFEAEREFPLGSGMMRWTDWTGFTYPFNLSQQPAAVVPIGRTARGLPVALQIVGRRHADAAVLACARRIEAIFGT